MHWPKRVIMRRKNGKRRGLTENSFFPENVNKISTLLYNHSNRFLNNAFDKKQQKDLKENKNKEQLNDKVSRTTFTTTDASRLKLGVTIVPLLNISTRNLHKIKTECRRWKHIYIYWKEVKFSNKRIPWSIESAVIGSWHDHYQLEAENGELFLIEQYQRGFKFPLFKKKAINWL